MLRLKPGQMFSLCGLLKPGLQRFLGRLNVRSNGLNSQAESAPFRMDLSRVFGPGIARERAERSTRFAPERSTELRWSSGEVEGRLEASDVSRRFPSASGKSTASPRRLFRHALHRICKRPTSNGHWQTYRRSRSEMVRSRAMPKGSQAGFTRLCLFF